MAIEHLQTYFPVSLGMTLCSSNNGPYVQAIAARAREDALLEALKYCLNSLDAYGFGGTLIDTQRAVVRQIEESR